LEDKVSRGVSRISCSINCRTPPPSYDYYEVVQILVYPGETSNEDKLVLDKKYFLVPFMRRRYKVLRATWHRTVIT